MLRGDSNCCIAVAAPFVVTREERVQALKMYWPLVNFGKRRRWRVVDTRKCFLVNLESEMRDFQDLETDLNCARDLTGSL